MRYFAWALAALVCLGMWGCTDSAKRFSSLPASQTGIDFNNQITESDSFNVLSFTYIYNGAGVATADFNNDGKTDVFFSGNMVSSRLYLNQQDFQFTDVTEAAGVKTQSWCTGVSVVDINADGWQDVYLSVAHPKYAYPAPNLLFVNQGVDENGIPHFLEQAATFGLNDSAYSTQAAFFDYDKDGDLDAYLLTNALERVSRNSIRPIVTDGTALSTDRFYRNNGDNTFTNVSQEAGITIEGWGLGVSVNDFNQDGWPDVYVANDFLSNDLMWINNGDGTFTNQIKSYLKHQSHNGMGNDVADFNNDGLVDIVVLDMMPDDNQRQKSMFPSPNYDRFTNGLRSGYNAQYVRNTLQLNNGNGTFSEVGLMADIYKTDWSWTPLLIDLDNDGWRDLLITNGYHRDVTDLDYISFTSQGNMFGTREEKRKRLRAAMNKLEGVKKHNYLFRNDGKLRFEDMSEEWGFMENSYSNGAAYADFDKDGDLDLVINNLNGEAFVYQNRLMEEKKEGQKPHFLRIALSGTPQNPHGQGAQIRVEYIDGGLTKELYHYQSLQRGYKSTVEPIAHFGLGMADKVASVEIVWPDGKTEKVQNPSIDQVLTLAYAGAKEPSENQAASQMAFIQPVKAEAIGLAHTHRDPDFVDFNLQGLLAHKHSQNGPAMAVGDVDGNGLDDLWLGAAKGDTAVLFMQVQPGKFRQKAFSVDEAGQEDMGGLWFDLENDGDLDLYVVSGGSEKRSDEAYYQDRLYVNDGRGNFQKRSDLLPELRSSGAAVSAADLDQDGDLDLFVSGRVVPWKYPTAPQHLLLRNDNGKLTDATAELAADVQEAGMITSALWTDFNGDSRPDLILAGEWTSLQFYANQNGKLVDVTETSGVSELSGWWNSLLATDFDADGDMDYVAGNLGLNSKYKASTEEPVCLYAKDFDKNGSIDPLLCHYIQGEEYATHSLDALHAQLVSTRQRYIYYADYGRTKAKELFPKQEWEGVEVFKATHFASTYFENLGNGRFKATALPIEAQIAPVYGMLSRDLNADGHPDLLLVGNSYASETQSGWYDASIGLALLNDGQGHFSPLSANESGFFVPGDAKSLVEIVTGEENSLILAAENRGPLRAFSPATKGQLRLSQQESLAVMYLADGGKRKLEIPFGSGYLSQSSRMLSLPEGVEKVELFDTKGEKIGELKP